MRNFLKNAVAIFFLLLIITNHNPVTGDDTANSDKQTSAEVGFPFSHLPLTARESAKLYDFRNSSDTDNPFGIFAHSELPTTETIRLMSDMGVGHVKMPQHKPDEFVELAHKLGVEIVVNSWLPKHPDMFKKIIAKHRGKITYYQTGGDEPNNNHKTPEQFVQSMADAAKIFRAAEPDGKLIMDDLGDNHPGRYLRKCLGLSLGNYVDYVAYGYFAWGQARMYYRNLQKMVNEDFGENVKHPKLFLAALQQFGNGASANHRTQKHFIDLYWCGAEFINMYKLLDWVGEFSILDFNGAITTSYIGFQNICQLVGRDLPPVYNFNIEAQVEPFTGPDILGKKLPRGWKEQKVETGKGFQEPYQYSRRRLWLRPFKNKNKLLIILYSQNQGFNDRSTWPMGTTCTLTLPDANYAYPVAVDLIKGRLHDLPYKIENHKIIIKEAPLERYAQGIMLLKRNKKWENHNSKPVNAREQNRKKWKTVTDMTEMSGDWITSILPDDNGGAWIGTCPLERGRAAIAHINKELKVKPINFAGKESDNITIGLKTIKLSKHNGLIYGAMHGVSAVDKNKKGRFFSFPIDADTIKDQYTPASKNASLARTLGFTDMQIQGNKVWLSAIGSAMEGAAGLGEAVSVFDIQKKDWQLYSHRRPNEIAGKKIIKGQWSGRFTAVLPNKDLTWVAAMKTSGACFDGKKWYILNEIRGAFSLCDDGRAVWFTSEKGTVYKVIARKKDGIYSFNVTTFKSTETGLNGRILYSAYAEGKVFFATRYNGIAEYDTATQKWTTWLPGDNNFTDAMVQGILLEGKRVWLYTWGKGISLLKQAKKDTPAQWMQITRKEGLVDNRVSAMAKGKDGSLWVGTYRGVSVHFTGR